MSDSGCVFFAWGRFSLTVFYRESDFCAPESCAGIAHGAESDRESKMESRAESKTESHVRAASYEPRPNYA